MVNLLLALGQAGIFTVRPDEADRKLLTPRVREGDVPIPEDLGAERVVL